MDGEIPDLVLNGMPFKEFIVFYLFAIAGSLAFFLYSLYKAISTDNTTPMKFSWKYMTKGAIRVLLSIIILALAIVFWDKISMFLFAVEDPIELNGWSAFLMGTLTDRLFEVALGGGQDAGKYVVKKLSTPK